MRTLYDSVQNILKKVNFNEIWPGFSLFNFALYNGEQVYFADKTIPYDRRFIGNTAIEYEGEYTAIWHVESPQNEDAENLSANLVHEMFHAFQRSKGETRYPNDLQTLMYPENCGNFQLKFLENAQLVSAFLESDQNKKRDFLANFISYRKGREAAIGDIIRQEYLTETLEGLAEYAGCMALRQTSREKYDARMGEYLKLLSADDDRLFDIRRISYYGGTIFAIVAARLDLPLFHDIGGAEKTLFEMLSATAPQASAGTARYSDRLESNLEIFAKGKQKRIDDFEKSHIDPTELNCTICGYDPMNMIRVGDKILCSHFVMLAPEGAKEKISLFQPALLIMEHGSANRVTHYII